MKDSKEIYERAKVYVTAFEEFEKMDSWLKTHSNEEGLKYQGRIDQIVKQASNALNSLLDATRLEA